MDEDRKKSDERIIELLTKMDEDRKKSEEETKALLARMDEGRKRIEEKMTNLLEKILTAIEEGERRAQETQRFIASLIKGESEEVKSLIKDLLKEKRDSDYG